MGARTDVATSIQATKKLFRMTVKYKTSVRVIGLLS